jgi:diguanylate cyclase (GGDEF)-like protein
MTKLKDKSTNGYVYAVIAIGLLVIIRALSQADMSQPFGPKVLIFAVFAALHAIGEARPIRWFTGREDLEITASWTFSLGLLFVAPLGAALVVVGTVSLVLELSRHKPLVRVLFNIAQITISLAAGASLMQLAGAKADLWNMRGPGVVWLLASASAGLLAVAANGVLTSIVLALSQQVSMRDVVRSTIQANAVMDLLLVMLAPVLTAIAAQSFMLVPLLLFVVVGVYQSARVGLVHRHEATHDLLTGLPNRRLFFEQSALTLDSARVSGRSAAILLIDLDGFKEINDRLGHATGDETLRVVAARLLRHRRATDVVARLGGDEFVVLLGGVDAEAAERVAWSILYDLKEPFEHDGIPLQVSGSVGLALFPTDGEDTDTVLGHADAAMYRAKSAELGVQVYQNDRDRNGPRRLGLISELREAIASDQLFLVYQPQIDIATGALCGVESLVRWQHPTRGLLQPDHFIPTVEHTELIDEMTEKVVRLAVAQAAVWSENGLNLRLGINASARNLLQRSFPNVVGDIAKEFGVPLNQLEIEITENTLTNDPDRTLSVVNGLRNLGVTISIDDFGTGYSSLAHLRSLPIDRIKIDRSFVGGMLTNSGDLAIVRCILDLAASLNVATVAEGVEDQAMLDQLQVLGCKVAQGYFIGRPGTAEQIVELARERGVVGQRPRIELTK